MEHRDRLEQYRRYEELTGAQTEEQKGAPVLKPWNGWMWDAFMSLSGSRSWTMGGAAAIPFSEVLAYMAWQGIGGEASEVFWQQIRAMDTVFVEMVNRPKG